jgi:undecaprenyl-diphosphatase
MRWRRAQRQKWHRRDVACNVSTTAGFCYNARVIRAYVPWYLVRNYWLFAFAACLGALQWAAACRSDAPHRRARYVVAVAILAGGFLGYYALAPELLTPGPAGGEATFLFGGAALLAVITTRIVGQRVCHSEPRSGEESRRKTETPRNPAALGDGSPHLKFGIWFLILVSLLAVLSDLALFRVLNGLALRTPIIDVAAQFLMDDYIVPTALSATLLALWFAGRDMEERAAFRSTALRALLALALASVTLKLINEFYFRPRPFTLDDTVRLLFYHPSDSSMPSNAATVCFALATSVWLRQKRWGVAMLALSAGMTLARVVGGVHYPADVVAGAWLGGLAAWLVNRAAWLDRLLDAVIGLALRLRLA